MASAMDNVLKQDARPYEVHKNRHVLASDIPADTPQMVVRWHYAVDVPKRRVYEKAGESKTKAPSNFVAFTPQDSDSLETTWTTTAEDAEPTKVAVNEDHLFEVDLTERELGPIYWRGPTYEVRRGTWHFAESGVLKPCEENLATQVEQGYLKVKPWREVTAVGDAISGDSTPTTTTTTKLADISTISDQQTAENSKGHRPPPEYKDKLLQVKSAVTPESSKLLASLKSSVTSEPKRDAQRDQIRPLFGNYAGKYVLYTGKTTAWLLSDDLYGKISSSFLQSVTRGVHMGGQKLKRGYADPVAPKTEPTTSKPDGTEIADAVASAIPGAMPTSPMFSKEAKEADAGTGTAPTNQSKMEKAFDVSGTDNPDRKIDHLILCCHGIGQKLGERMESVNFVHDVNVLRRNFKSTFMQSRDLQTLSADRYNSGVQLLPIEWRQNIQFGMSKDYEEPSQKSETDLANALENGNEEEHATLEDITIEGVQTIRNLVSDVLLDILLYYQPSYREKIVRAVSKEMNRVYALFRERNPSFDGKVSILGHSLGSAIAFDILCRQPTSPGESKIPKESTLDKTLALDFPAENFYAVGSPIGLFQMLRGKNIAARSQLSTAELPFSPLGERSGNPFEAIPISYPKVKNLYNIFHPADPVSYRVEPLISKHTARLKPYPIPYTKAGFRQQLVGLSNIPQRAYEGASSYWGALRSSITNSIVSRSLGYGDLSSPTASTSTSASKAVPEDEKQKVANEINKQHEETLFAAFEKAWGSNNVKKAEGSEKLRALNKSGRVDFQIQEDLFSASYMSAISAHLAYWGDSDVAYFILSYVLLHGRQETPVPDASTASSTTPQRMKPTRYKTDL